MSQSLRTPADHPSGFRPLACVQPARRFPNWTVGSISQVPSDVAKIILLTLLTAPPQTVAVIAWSTTYDFESIKQFYRELK